MTLGDAGAKVFRCFRQNFVFLIAFAEKDIAEGDTIVVHNPIYNVYEDNVEMVQGTLVKKK